MGTENIPTQVGTTQEEAMSATNPEEQCVVEGVTPLTGAPRVGASPPTSASLVVAWIPGSGHEQRRVKGCDLH